MPRISGLHRRATRFTVWKTISYTLALSPFTACLDRYDFLMPNILMSVLCRLAEAARFEWRYEKHIIFSALRTGRYTPATGAAARGYRPTAVRTGPRRLTQFVAQPLTFAWVVRIVRKRTAGRYPRQDFRPHDPPLRDAQDYRWISR
jgi:hypothetical protein